MRIARKPVAIMASAALAAAMVAFVAVWAWNPILGGSSSNAGLTWNVEYWHKNADGEVLQHKKQSNAIVANGLEYAVERLAAELTAEAGLTFADPAATQIGTANAFDQIVLLDTDDAATGGIAATAILFNVDGGTGSNAGQAAGGPKWNPADGLYANVGTNADGDGSVTLQFLADGDPAAATQMHLVKAATEDQAVAGDGLGTAIAELDILATIEITVDLADTDTLTHHLDHQR